MTEIIRKLGWWFVLFVAFIGGWGLFSVGLCAMLVTGLMSDLGGFSLWTLGTFIGMLAGFWSLKPFGRELVKLGIA